MNIKNKKCSKEIQKILQSSKIKNMTIHNQFNMSIDKK